MTRSGIAVLLLAFLVFATSRVMAGAGHHAYDPGSAPRSSYRLTADRTYQMSTSGGVGELSRRGVIGDGSDLRCTADAPDETSTPLTVDQTSRDSRDLHIIGSFVAPSSGTFVIRCEGTGPIYLDDADNNSTDRSAPLVVLASVLALAGVIVALSGAYRVLEPELSSLAGSAPGGARRGARGRRARGRRASQEAATVPDIPDTLESPSDTP